MCAFSVVVFVFISGRFSFNLVDIYLVTRRKQRAKLPASSVIAIDSSCCAEWIFEVYVFIFGLAFVIFHFVFRLSYLLSADYLFLFQNIYDISESLLVIFFLFSFGWFLLLLLVVLCLGIFIGIGLLHVTAAMIRLYI